MVVPDGHDKEHTAFESSSHVGQDSLLIECIVIAKGSSLCVTEHHGYGDASDVGNQGLRIGDDLAALDAEWLDLSEWVTDELSENGELLGGIHGQARAVESGVSHALGAEVASIGIAPFHSL